MGKIFNKYTKDNKKSPFNGKNKLISCYNASIRWILNNTIPEQGIVVTSKQKIPYLEVTGYLIPTMFDAGESKLAEQYAEFLSYMQRPNGSYAGPDGREYIFDSGQALRGLVRASQQWDKFTPFALKTADYIASSVDNNGRIASIYGNDITEYVHVYILPALKEAANILNKPEYLGIVKRSIEYYKRCPDILDDKRLTHFLAYIIDGFIDMGETDFVRPLVKQIFASQAKNGSISAYPDVNWTCSTGLAQLAIIGYKLEMYDEADKAIGYLCNIQNSTGGFYGSYGKGAKYFSDEEISWANKFFIDAIHLKVSSFFNNHNTIFSKDIYPDDGRLSGILEQFGNLENKKILDAGCGKGRFSIKIKERFPNCEIHGVDISRELLKEVPSSIATKQGSILNLEYESETFDAVFCVEALEHVLRIEKGISELCRVLKENGKIIVIDKNIKKLGAMNITDFEQWFNKNEVEDLLRIYCSGVSSKEINYDHHKKDGLFLLWTGTKGESVLNEKEWHNVIVGDKSVKELANRIRNNVFPLWCKPILQYTKHGDSILELGCGTGEISAILGVYSRIPILVDFSNESIEYTNSLFNELGIKGQFHCQDILHGLQMNTSSVDWVWSSGLLEHFSDEKILKILEESVRVCKKGVMSLVPNANSVFYRIGKYKLEQNKKWLYGREIPKYSMKPYFEASGLKNIKEFSIGTHHALNFWGLKVSEITSFLDGISYEEMQKLNQGYLLFTYGEKK